MPSISQRLRPASVIANSAALLIRSSEEEPSCLPNAVRPTPVMKLMTVETFDATQTSSFRDAPSVGNCRPEATGPESILPVVVMDSGLARGACHRAGQRPDPLARAPE